MIFKILFYIALLFMTAFAPLGLLIICMCVYAFVYTAYELIFLAMIVDALYGGNANTFIIPYYTLCTIVGLIIIEWVKPRFFVYNQ